MSLHVMSDSVLSVIVSFAPTPSQLIISTTITQASIAVNMNIYMLLAGGVDQSDDDGGGRGGWLAGACSGWELGSRAYTASGAVLATAAAPRHPAQGTSSQQHASTCSEYQHWPFTSAAAACPLCCHGQLTVCIGDKNRSNCNCNWGICIAPPTWETEGASQNNRQSVARCSHADWDRNA